MHRMQPHSLSFCTPSNIRVFVVSSMLLHRPRSSAHVAFLFTAVSSTPSCMASQSALLLKLTPSLHCDLGAVKFAFIFNARFLRLLACCLASVTPGEVIKLPECVGWKDEIPDWQRKQVDEHPHHVGPSVGCENNENGWQTKNKGQEHERDDLRRGPND